MKCPKCGNEVADDLKFCDQCGAAMTEEGNVAEEAVAKETAVVGESSPEQAGEAVDETNQKAEEKKTIAEPVEKTKSVEPDAVVEQTAATELKINTFGLVGFIVGIAAMFIGFWGLTGAVAIVFSAIGMHNFDPNTEKGKGFAIAGLVLGIVGVVWGIVSLFLAGAFISTLL